MKNFSRIYIFLFSALIVSGCAYAPPPRSYVLAQNQLIRRASVLEHSLARSVFLASYAENPLL